MPIVNVMLRETSAVRNVIKADKMKSGSRTNDISIDDIREIKNMDTDKPVIIFDFQYKANYELEEPKDQTLGELVIRGEVFYVADKKDIKKIVSEWEKDKKVDPSVMTNVLNVALNKCQVEAIEQSSKIGLPSPIPLPILKQQKPEKSGKSSAA